MFSFSTCKHTSVVSRAIFLDFPEMLKSRGAYHLSEGTGWDEQMTLNNGKGFSKISKPTERDGAYHSITI